MLILSSDLIFHKIYKYALFSKTYIAIMQKPTPPPSATTFNLKSVQQTEIYKEQRQEQPQKKEFLIL